jgi:hypothetical protein
MGREEDGVVVTASAWVAITGMICLTVIVCVWLWGRPS